MKTSFTRILLTLFVISAAHAAPHPYWAKPVPIPKVADQDKICFTLYTVQNKTMKMMVQLFPLGPKHSREVRLEVQQDGAWKEIAKGTVRENEYGFYGAKAWNLLFRIENWDESKDWPYRVVALDGVATYKGLIRRDPVDKEEIVVAAFTGNSRWDKGSRMDMVRAVEAQDPDLLFFSGDQVYHHTSHLAEWLIFGREFGHITRNRPTVCLPDDHDVGQGNLWGASGKLAKMAGGYDGGYERSAQYVKEVEFAQTSNLPDPYDPTPVQRGIGVYYTSLNVGGIDFAIIEDRKFKQGPLQVFPKGLKGKRPDMPSTKNPLELDDPKAVMLGERQLKFLDHWGQDWSKAQMKCTLSATIFCQASTNSKIDLDSNGWPQSGRNRALETIRKSYAFMLAGDQHLATVIQHGVKEFGDSGYSFCVPSIVNHYPRKWTPNKPAVRSIKGQLKGLGDYYEGLGNRITMYAHANPDAFRPPLKTRNLRAKQATGHGLVRFNKKTRNITMECWPRGMDTSKPNARQYPGWPMTISQQDNYGRKAKAYLPTLQIAGEPDPVVQVINEKNNELVYTLRIKGNSFRPKVFESGSYTLRIGEGKNIKTLQGVQSLGLDEQKTLQVK